MQKEKISVGAFFYEFYEKLSSLRESKQETDVIQKELEKVLKSQVEFISLEGKEFARERCKNVHYAMIALADDIFIKEKKRHWLENLMEEKVFGTHNAGEIIFNDIDRVIDEEIDFDMANIYLTLLSLGFSGKYHNQPEKISEISSKIFVMLHGVQPVLDLEIIFGGMNINEEKNVISYKESGKNPKIIFVVFGLYLIVSHAIWLLCTKPVACAVATLQDRSSMFK